MRRLLIALALLLPLAPSRTSCGAAPLPRDRVDAIVREPIEKGWIKGCVIGLISSTDRVVYGYGEAHDGAGDVPTGKTLFEIGSVTKTFTATLLATMVESGEVRLDQPVRELLPPDVKVPSKDGVEITLLTLTDQTSGLPRMPSNFNPADPLNPYADYTSDLLYQALASIQLDRKPGERYDYSNLGVGLLGHALARRGGKSYEQMILDRICKPLRMNDTRITLDQKTRPRLAQGHDLVGFPMPPWDQDALAGAGAIRSCADDMLTFLAANLGVTNTPLKSALMMTHQRRAAAGDTIDIAMGWHIGKRTGARWHDGETGGYCSFVGFVEDKKVGVVVLINSASRWVDPIGTQLLEALLKERS